MTGELSTLVEARTLLAGLAAQCTPLPWKAEGHDVYYVEGFATILTADDPYPRGDNAPVENALLVETLSRTVQAQLWIIHCAILATDRTGDTALAEVQAGVTLAQAILDTQHPANVALRAKILQGGTGG